MIYLYDVEQDCIVYRCMYLSGILNNNVYFKRTECIILYETRCNSKDDLSFSHRRIQWRRWRRGDDVVFFLSFVFFFYFFSYQVQKASRNNNVIAFEEYKTNVQIHGCGVGQTTHLNDYVQYYIYFSQLFFPFVFTVTDDNKDDPLRTKIMSNDIFA